MGAVKQGTAKRIAAIGVAFLVSGFWAYGGPTAPKTRARVADKAPSRIDDIQTWVWSRKAVQVGTYAR